MTFYFVAHKHLIAKDYLQLKLELYLQNWQTTDIDTS